MRILFFCIFCLFLSFGHTQTTDNFSVMSYNLLKFPEQNSTRIADLKTIVQEALPDILLVCELTSASGANAVLNDALNQNGINYYDKANYVPSFDTENMLYYNSNLFGLVEQNEIGTSVRDINEYVLYYKSADIATTTDTTFFYIYICHLKAGSAEAATREQQATVLKQYMATRSNAENIIVGGDFNLYGASEDAWSTILNEEGVSLVDPISTPGEWHADWGYASVHTQSTRTTSIDSGASGGLDDRFDFIFMSNDLENWGSQAKYVDGTYWAYGQDGNHYNDNLTDAPTNTSLPWTVIQALYDMSDHLPVYMEIEVQKTYNGIAHQNKGIHAFYNAKKSFVQFTFDEVVHWNKTIQIYDLSGKLVRSGSLADDNRFHVKDLEAGMYILRADELELSMKFVR